MGITIKVSGLPIAWSRARTNTRGGRTVFFTDERVAAWKREIVLRARLSRPVKPLEGPVFLRIQFGMPRSKKRDPGEYWHFWKPDLDNLIKAVKDALTAAELWRDDCQVAEIQAAKILSVDPGAEITITELDAGSE
jgi:Holliday junction resolvase RusA-like endonuclease